MRIFLPLLPLIACNGGAHTDSAVDTDTDAPVDTDTGLDMPGDPSPFTVVVSGAVPLTLAFDEPTCTVMGQNYRVFWRNTAREHVFVLVAETLGQYDGVGAYDQSLPNTRAKLQEEAGGDGIGPFQTGIGDTFVLTVEHLDDDPYADVHRTWGFFDVGGMHDPSGGLVTIEPTQIPIWCQEIN